jgi:hypothetical protein
MHPEGSSCCGLMANHSLKYRQIYLPSYSISPADYTDSYTFLILFYSTSKRRPCPSIRLRIETMALSTHLLHSFEHQQALSTHRQLYPTQNPSVKREPFTPQYIITEPPPPAPQYNPHPSAAYNGSHGKPLPDQSTTRMDPSAVQGDRKPPITQRAPKAASHAFAMPPPSPLNTWEHHAPADPTPSTSFYGGGGGFGQTQNQYHTQTQYPQTQQGENTQFMQMSAYTAGQIATLQSRLQKQLGPEYIMERKGPSGGPTLR